MASIEFRQVETAEDRAYARSFVLDYLSWLNDRVRAQYEIGFDVEGMVESDLADAAKFYPPHGRFYLAVSAGPSNAAGWRNDCVLPEEQ